MAALSQTLVEPRDQPRTHDAAWSRRWQAELGSQEQQGHRLPRGPPGSPIPRGPSWQTRRGHATGGVSHGPQGIPC